MVLKNQAIFKKKDAIVPVSKGFDIIAQSPCLCL